MNSTPDPVDIIVKHVKLQAIPMPILHLRCLKSLAMGHNRLQSIPSGAWLNTLESVNLASNCLSISESELAARLPKLKTLEMAGNREEQPQLYRA